MKFLPVFRGCIRGGNAQAFTLLPLQLRIGSENPIEVFGFGPALGFSELAVAFGKTVKPTFGARRGGPAVRTCQRPYWVARRLHVRSHGPGVCQICHEWIPFFSLLPLWEKVDRREAPRRMRVLEEMRRW